IGVEDDPRQRHDGEQQEGSGELSADLHRRDCTAERGRGCPRGTARREAPIPRRPVIRTFTVPPGPSPPRPSSPTALPPAGRGGRLNHYRTPGSELPRLGAYGRFPSHSCTGPKEVRMSALRRCLLSVVLLLAVAAAAAAQTTGSIVGRVTDEAGGVLPGATVEAKSPSLQGSRTAVTDGTGAYRLELLLPGEYTVVFSLDGFATQSHEGIAVGLDRVTTLNASLRAAATGQITVTSDAPVIDTTSTSLGSNLDDRAIRTLPTARNYSAVVQITPGVSTDANPEDRAQSDIAVYGSTGAENVYYIDGVNTTGAEYGFQGKELNFEFIQAVDVKTGGYEAELGRSTGGIINVITKSGGNEFHGDVFGYFDNDSLQSNAEDVVATGGTIAGFTRKDFGLDLGGYF